MMTYRDVTMTQLEKDHVLVTGCDSCGGIGLKSNDTLEVAPEIVGAITARVALLEVLSLGASVVSVAVPISNEPDETGRRLLSGVKTCLNDFDLNVPVLTSMEKNMPTTMTALGVVVNGLARELKRHPFSKGDKLYVLGRPSVGQEVIEYGDDLFNSEALKTLVDMDAVREILPVGSRGILGELDDMFRDRKREYQLLEDLNLDMEKSCGPSTVAIVVVGKETRFNLDIPSYLIGEVI